MNIALDFDGTYTEDPSMWQGFVASARERGHAVWVVTMRYEDPAESTQVHEELGGLVDGFMFTGRQLKKPFCEERGLQIDVWIDDWPQYITDESTPFR